MRSQVNKYFLFFFVLFSGILLAFASEARMLSAQHTKMQEFDELGFRKGAIQVIPKKQRTDADDLVQDPVFDAFAKGAILCLPRGGSGGDDDLADLDDYEETEEKTEISDPLEGWNRFWFRFNDAFFVYVAKPLYHGWETITPHQLRAGLKNFFHNALFPVRFINNILQFRFKAAGVEFGRFMMNTMCSAGFANPAKKKKTIVSVDESGEDFGQTLGVWGIGHGPYLVLPFLGPSSLRDAVGFVGDIFASPFYYLQPWYVSWSAAGLLRFNNLDEVLPLYDDITGAALDPYIFMREAYINHRNYLLKQ